MAAEVEAAPPAAPASDDSLAGVKEIVQIAANTLKDNEALRRQVEAQQRTQDVMMQLARERQKQREAEAAAVVSPPPCPVAAPPPPRPAPRPPPPPPRTKRREWARALLVVLVATLLGLISRFALGGAGAAPPPRTVIVYPLLERPRNEECVPLTPDEIRAGSFLGGKHQLVDVSTSMLYHMRARGLSGICAQHVGVPACYCALDLTRATPSGLRLPARSLRHPAPDQATRNSDEVTRNLNAAERYLEDEVLHLFDPQIVGASRRLVVTSEANAYCPERHSSKRHESVYASFYDRRGEPYEMLFNGTHSINVQHALEIHAGQVRCEDDAEHLLQRAILSRLDRLQETLESALHAPSRRRQLAAAATE